MTDDALPSPEVQPDTAPFWEAANGGRLFIKRCAHCGEQHFYPRVLCPFCFADATEWVPASGLATLYSYTVMRRSSPPYAIAYVTLDEGPTMLTNIVDCDLDTVRIGQRLRVVFRPAQNGQSVPMFTPITPAA
jgi:uncharacterized OB-fold protein